MAKRYDPTMIQPAPETTTVLLRELVAHLRENGPNCGKNGKTYYRGGVLRR
jgi:hypothetical protein